MPVFFKKNALTSAKPAAGPTSGQEEKPGVVITFPTAKELSGEIGLTEDDVAEDFAQRYVASLRFDHDQGRWFRWDGARWSLDKTGLAFDYARRLCRKHRGTRSAMASRRAAEGVEHMARRDQSLATTSTHWDRNPFLMGTPGGTVDLRSGELHPANREDFITRLTAVAPAPQGAQCLVFDKFLDDATGKDKELKRFIQQWAGYCLTGETSEQALVFLYGPGGNGKGVLLNVLMEVMADYAKTAAMGMFVDQKHQRHLAELAMLSGARLVTASETEKTQSWSESRINQLTGEDPITANFMRQNHFTHRPTYKLMYSGNHKPKLNTVNDAARRRFNIVPFLHKPQAPDKMLRTRLRKEYPAILRWMIDGCMDWQSNSLTRPPIVTNATTEYFQEQDILKRWLDEKCETGPGKKEAASKLYGSWKEFALENGEEPGTMTAFGSLLPEQGFEKKKSGGYYYIGVQLKAFELPNP
jgi:putative DNA primase/helicase